MKLSKILPTTLVCIAGLVCSTANAELVDNSTRNVTITSANSNTTVNKGPLVFDGNAPKTGNMTGDAKDQMCKSMIPMAQAIMTERQNGMPKEKVLSLVNQNKLQYRVQYGNVMTEVAYSQAIEKAPNQKELIVQIFTNEFYNFCLNN